MQENAVPSSYSMRLVLASGKQFGFGSVSRHSSCRERELPLRDGETRCLLLNRRRPAYGWWKCAMVIQWRVCAVRVAGITTVTSGFRRARWCLFTCKSSGLLFLGWISFRWSLNDSFLGLKKGRFRPKRVTLKRELWVRWNFLTSDSEGKVPGNSSSRGTSVP